MAKRAAAPKNPPNSTQETLENDPGEAIRAINAAAGGDAEGEWVISVYRVTGSPREGSKQPWLFDTTYDQLRGLNADLAQSFPEGGRFRIMARLNGQIYKAFYLDIERRPGYAPPAARPWTPPADAAPAPAARQDDGVIQVLRAMQQEQRDFMTALVTKLSAPAPVDPTAQFANMMQQFQALATMMPKPSTENALSMFEKGLELGAKVAGAGGGGGEGESNLIDLVRDFIKSDMAQGLAGAVLKAQQPAATAPAAVIQHNPRPLAPLGPRAPGQQQQRAQQQPADQQEQLRNAIAMLKERAKSGADPAIVADQLLDTLPVRMLDQIAEHEDIVGFIVGIDPEVNAFRPWFEALVENLLEEEQPSEQAEGGDGLAPNSDSVTGREGGDARNP